MQKELLEAILQYNRSIGNDIQEIGEGPFVITGQQLGLFCGPAYTFHKAVSAVRLAKELGTQAIFWLATEDHDVGEIDHTYFIDEKGDLDRFFLKFPKDRTPVESLILEEGHREEIERFITRFDLNDLMFTPGKRYADVMARAFARAFKGTGLIFLEPKILRPFAKEFFHKELAQHPENLFFINDSGQREKVQKECDRLHRMIDDEPLRMTTNVYARCALQCALLPTEAYVAGPSESEYWSTLPEYFQEHNLVLPTIVPRLSFTMVTKELQEIQKKQEPSPKELHKLKNFLHPRQKPQERVLNSLALYSHTSVSKVIETIDPKNPCYLTER